MLLTDLEEQAVERALISKFGMIRSVLGSISILKITLDLSGPRDSRSVNYIGGNFPFITIAGFAAINKYVDIII